MLRSRLKSFLRNTYLFRGLCLWVLAVVLAIPAQGSSPESSESTATDSTQTTNQESASSKRILQGSVEHSESLPSLDESLRPGSKYKEDVLLKLGTAANNDWFWIPSWYAGKRHTDEALIVTGMTSIAVLRQRLCNGNWKDRIPSLVTSKTATAKFGTLIMFPSFSTLTVETCWPCSTSGA